MSLGEGLSIHSSRRLERVMLAGSLFLFAAAGQSQAEEGSWRLVGKRMEPSSEKLAELSRPPPGRVLVYEADVGLETGGGRATVHVASDDADHRLCDQRTSFSFTADRDLHVLRGGDTVNFSGTVEASGNDLAAAAGAYGWGRISIGQGDYLLDARAAIGAPVAATGVAQIPKGPSSDHMIIHFADYLGGCQSLNVDMLAEYEWVAGPAPATDAAPGAGSSNGFAGDWESDNGAVSLVASGGHVTGSYTGDGGRLDGVEQDGTLSGYWAEGSSDQPCASERLGTVNWGRFTWTLGADGRSFAGSWSYCDADPATQPGGSWTGTR
jgi:hypothetical protein